jgi:hypothetical protein
MEKFKLKKQNHGEEEHYQVKIANRIAALGSGQY